jgi:hypothetical protein
MELVFDISQQIAAGNNPAAVHFEDNTVQAFYTGDGARLYGIDTTTPEGVWDTREFSSPLVVAPDFEMQYFVLRHICRNRACCVWQSDNRHRFAFYKGSFDIEKV